MEPPNGPLNRQSNQYYINPEWRERANPAECSTQHEQSDLGQKQRRNSIQSHAHAMTVPTGHAGQPQLTKQHSERGANLALRYHREPVTEQRARSRTVYDSGGISAGQSVTTKGPAPSSKMRHLRRGSNTTAVDTSPLMNPSLPSSTTSGRIGGGRPKRRDILDAPRHARRTSRSQSVLMAAATTELTMDTTPIWNPPPLFDGRIMRDYPANMGSQTLVGHAPYPYDTGRTHLTYQAATPEAAATGFAAPVIPANGGRLHPGIGAANMRSFSSRSSIGLPGSLERSPASTGADGHPDSHLYSHNQHGDHYVPMASTSQYPNQESFDYTQVAQPSHVEPMSANLQPPQPTDAMYTQGPHAHYYHSSQSHSPASPRVPLRSSPHQGFYQPYITAPNITVTPFSTTVDDIGKLNQVSYIPPQHHLQSPLPAVSSPSEMSEPPERHSPTLQNRSRVPGQRVDVDSKLLENSFGGNDDQSRVRRQVLADILRQSFFHLDQDEPKMDVHTHREILNHGLGMVGRSIYTVFLVEDKESNQWKCLFGSEDIPCKRSDKRYERVERAIEHVRSHLGHRPYACDGTCHKAKSTGINCGKRFFAAGYLEDHKKRPQKRANVP